MPLKHYSETEFGKLFARSPESARYYDMKVQLREQLSTNNINGCFILQSPFSQLHLATCNFDLPGLEEYHDNNEQKNNDVSPQPRKKRPLVAVKKYSTFLEPNILCQKLSDLVDEQQEEQEEDNNNVSSATAKSSSDSNNLNIKKSNLYRHQNFLPTFLCAQTEISMMMLQPYHMPLGMFLVNRAVDNYFCDNNKKIYFNNKFDLVSLMEKYGFLPENEALYIFQQIVDVVALYQISCKRGGGHNGLSLQNIFISDPNTLQVKVGDFAYSTLLSAEKTRHRLESMNPMMVLPENFDNDSSDRISRNKGDVWELANIYYLLLGGKIPFYSSKEYNVMQMLRDICSGNTAPLPDCVSAGARNLLKRMHTVELESRISISEILNDKYFQTGTPFYRGRKICFLIKEFGGTKLKRGFDVYRILFYSGKFLPAKMHFEEIL